MKGMRGRAAYSTAGTAGIGLGRGALGRRGSVRGVSGSAGRYRSPYAGMGLGLALRRRLTTRWSVTTSLALMAVLFIFVDSMLTVEIQRVSLDAHGLRKDILAVTMELDALDATWASKSSPLELDTRAAQLGLRVPEPDQVVLLQPGFMEEETGGGRLAREELRRGLFNVWACAVAMGVR